MLRALIILGIVVLVWRWALGRWPWDDLRPAARRAQALARARRLLGVEPGASREEVIAAHRRLTALVHPDRGGTTTAMQEANAARDLLLAELPDPPPSPD